MSGFQPAEDMGDLIARYGDDMFTSMNIDKFEYGYNLFISSPIINPVHNRGRKTNLLGILSGTPAPPKRFMGQEEEIRMANISLRLLWVNFGTGREILTAIMDYVLGKDIYIQPNLKASEPEWRSFITEQKAKDAVKSMTPKAPPPIKYLDVNSINSEPLHPGKLIEQQHVLSCNFRMVYPQSAM